MIGKWSLPATQEEHNGNCTQEEGIEELGDRKNMANFMPEYSMWKPAINSDSASSRSKGVCSASASD